MKKFSKMLRFILGCVLGTALVHGTYDQIALAAAKSATKENTKTESVGPTDSDCDHSGAN